MIIRTINRPLLLIVPKKLIFFASQYLNIPFKKHALQKHRLPLVIGLLLTYQVAAHGATLTVVIRSVDGGGFSEARVCIIGAGLNPAVGLNKFAVTKSDGTAAFTNVPQGDFTLTVSKSGFVGFSVENLTMGPADFTYYAPTFLVPGSGGPVCSEPPPSAIAISNPKITGFEISGRSGGGGSGLDVGDTTTNPNLNLQVEIDHPDRVQFYRLGEITCPESVSDHAEDRMKNLPWQPYSQGMSFSFRLNTAVAQPYGTRCVFMEINRTQNESSASAAKGDSIVLAPASLKTFTLTGSELRNFIDRAKALGYKFTLTDHAITGDSPCPSGTFIKNSNLVIRSANAAQADFFEVTTSKLFDRNERFLNPFWKMTGIAIPGDGAQVTITGPPSGRADDPFRTVGMKYGYTYPHGSGQGVLPSGAPGISCVPTSEPDRLRAFDSGIISSITLEGPDDKQPQDAFFDLTRPTFQLKPIRTIPRP